MPSLLAWKVSQEFVHDMVIAGRDEMEHDRNFLAFMEKCMRNNLTLNSEKIQFKQSQASFYGHCWLKQGIPLDPKKIKALNHMELPLHKENMRSFLGMVNYLNRYSALVNIYKKHMIDISSRIQRPIIRSSPYLPFEVVYKKGVPLTAVIATAIIAIVTVPH